MKFYTGQPKTKAILNAKTDFSGNLEKLTAENTMGNCGFNGLVQK